MTRFVVLGCWVVVCLCLVGGCRKTHVKLRTPRPVAREAERPVRKAPPKPYLASETMRFSSDRPGPSDHRVGLYRRRIVEVALRSLGHRRMRCAAGIRFRGDCSGWVRCVYSHLRLDVFQAPRAKRANGVLRMRHYVGAYGTYHNSRRPAIGDLAFWHYTYDKDGDGMLDDLWTHVGIVERVEADGRIVILHYNRRVKRLFMYLPKPDVHQVTSPLKVATSCPRSRRGCRLQTSAKPRCKRGDRRCRREQKSGIRTLNDPLVSPSKAGLIYGSLTGELSAGFGSVVQLPLPRHLSVPRLPMVLFRHKSTPRSSLARLHTLHFPSR